MLALCAFPSMAGAADKAERCMAGICLEQPITQKMLVAKYGPGRKRLEPGLQPDTVARCYYDKKQDLYVEFNFDMHVETIYNSDLSQIMVSRAPMCSKRYAPKRPFPKLVTDSGLTVGSSEAEVEAALGKPFRTADVAEMERTNYATFPQEDLMRDYLSSAYGTTARIYGLDPKVDPLENEFFISDGKVKSVLLSVAE